MYSKNNKKMIIQKKQEKINYYGIKKFKIGTASVLIAAGFAFLGSNAFASDSQQSNSNVSVNRVEGNTNSVTSEKNVGINSKVDSTDKKETLEKTTQQVQKDQTTQPMQPTVDKQINKSELVNSINRLQTAIDSADVSDKTKSTIEEAKLELTSAKSLEQSSTTTQEEINRKVVELKNKAFVLESMKKATSDKKEEKVNKNNDPRNGKVIPGKGESGFRAPETQTNNDVAVDGGKITASGSISTEPRMGSFSGVNNITYNLKFKDGAYKQGDKFSLTFEELGNGDSLPKELSKDGKVFAKLKETKELYNQRYGKNGTQNKTSFWAQRDDSVSLEEKEAGHFQNRGTKTQFIYEFTSAIESLTDVTFKGSINNYSLRYPQISEDKEVTSKILVNDQPVVEKKYIMNKTNIEVDKESNAPSVLSTTGSMDISENGELLSHNEEFRLASNKYEYDTGTTIKIKLKNKNLNKFAKIGNFNPAKANVQNNITTANSKVNENGVILKEPRGDVYFQVTNLTEDEVTVKIVKGKASKGILYKVDWAALGVSREPVKDTLKLYHSDTKKFGPTEEEITVTRDGEEGNLNGQFSPTMTFEWIYPKKNTFDTNGTWLADYLELGNVAMRYVNAANNNSILKAKSIVKDGTAEVDKFATSAPEKDFTEANVATETNNTTKKVETQNGNIKTTTATAPYIIKGADNKYYIFKEYVTKNSPYNRTSTSGTVYDAVSNIVAAYDEAKYGKVTVKYVKSNDTSSVIKENVLKDGTAKLENIVGNNYSVTPDEEFTENGVVYKLVKTDLPNNSSGTLTENPIEVIYKYVAKNQKANVVVKTTDGKSTTTVELTGEPGTSLPNSNEIVNKIKELKGKGYEIESDSYNINGDHPNFDDQEDTVAGVSKPSQTFEIVLKPRIVEVPSSTPHEKDSPVDPNGETPELKWPEGLAESDLNTSAKRVISYVKKESDTAAEEKAKDDTIQKVSFTRKASVNLVTKEVTYTDWESPNKSWNKVEVGVLPGYIADKKEIPVKEVATPDKNTKVIPDETEKVTYTKIGSWIPVDPTTGKDGEPIPFPNDPNDPTKTGEITQIIPHKDGYTPKDGNGTPLEPVNPANPEQGYKPPKITDPKANIKITYEKDDQKAKVKFVSVDPKTQTETELTEHALTLTGKTGEIIPESDVQTRIDVLKSMGYDIVDNSFDKDPVFDTKKDTDENISQEFTIKVQPRVSTAKTVYVVEGDKPSSEKVGEAVTPGKDGKVTNPDVSNISTEGKAGQEIKVPVTVTYGANQFKRDESVEVTVKVLPKPSPKGVTVLNGTPNETLIDAIRASVKKAIDGLTNVPKGVTPFITDDAIVTPKTDKNGQQTPVTVTIKYRDNATGKVIDDVSVNVDVPVNVVGSTPTSKVVFEGDEITAKDITDAVTPGENGTKGEPKDLAKDITAKPGVKEVTVPVTYTDQNGETLIEPVKVKVIVLPKPTPKGIIVAKDSDKEKAKEKVLAKAKESIEDSEFKGKLPANVTNVSIDENVENPDLSDDTDVNVTVKYIVDGEEKTTVIKVPVTVVEGVPQIVPVDENNKQQNPENSIDKTEYPDGSTFEYDPKTPIDTTTPGDYKVNVIVKDKEGNPIAEVPATVRVVESYPQFVSVDKDNKQPNAEGSIDPKAFPKGTEFSYETPVDTSTPGEKDVVVVAKIGDKVITKIPAKIVVVEPKTQYVAVDKNNKQPDASKSINPEQYPDGITFKYKAPVDTKTPGEKDVIVEAKDGDDTLVEVPAKVKVVEGKEQLIPVNPTEKPQAKDSITPGDYPEGSTFEYKVPDGETEPFDATTIGDKPVTVVVKDKNGKVLVEVPATIKVVEAKPTPIETPVTNTPITKDDIAKYVKVPEGGKVTKVENIPDLTTPGKKNPVKVTVTLPNGKTTIVEVPVNVTPVKPIETPVTTTPLTPEDYTKGIVIPEGGKVTKVENIPDLTTPGKKDPVKVTVELPNGKVITVEVQVNVTPVKPIETSVTATPFTPEDYTKGIKIPEGGKVTKVENIPDLTTPGKKDPVKVTVELPNGKVITVEVPVNVTPVKLIETPVTATPFTPEDYTKGIKIPEGGKVTKVENILDLTTPGKKDPVKVTVELPNGKVITVEVPVNVTPVKPIETPVTTTPFTPEDYTKGIKIPEGGKVTKVENIPDLTTPGKKTPVKVTIELPNGKVIIVEVPVNITPVKGLEIPVTKTPLQPEDYTKGITIPEGGKVTKVENIPDLTTPGKKTPVKVTVELPNGKVITVEVPITVTPATGIETPVTDTPLTKEDIEKHVKVPEGGKIIGVGEIPKVNTPGDKGTVKVKIELPNGKQIEVEVPVNVTPIKDIVKKLGEPITNEEVEKHVKIPKGGKVISIGDKPSTDVPGERPSIPVVIELPGGKRVTVKVPVIVTPKTTPIVVKVGTPITQDDVKKHVDLPEGWKITKVGEIPTTTTPGEKTAVPVEIELPNGQRVTVNVPVKVIEKQRIPENNTNPNNADNNNNNGNNNYHNDNYDTDNRGNENNNIRNGEPNDKHQDIVTLNNTSKKAKVEKLPNTGVESNSIAGYGLAILGIALSAMKRRKEK
ncbi:Rib/alpha-like domain-containing protein [Gemella haemolysans]|uniref:Rib/alpha-like domain-containing protein n=1 Tax=Gemella haemolysans TaxID=1379 RepID=UPI00232B5B94|nr:Rib/alpha-like domain-containing protein [Gemella haemolysans]MDB6213515.1 Rib/alpha-like domain-containing protein [Gemella haemolysans]